MQGMAQQTIRIRPLGEALLISGFPEDTYFRSAATHLGELRSLAEIARRLCPAGSVILDIGANLGLSALMLADAVPTATIHALEPVPRTFACLEANVSQLGSRVRAHNLAIAAARGTVAFHESGDSSASHILGDEHIVGDPFRNGASTVYALTLDEFVEDQRLPRVDLVKIDVEGFEIDVLNGMIGTLERHQPVIYMEFNSWTAIAFRNINPRDLLRTFVELMPDPFRVNRDGTFSRISNSIEQYEFMYDNIHRHGCVDDLVGCPDTRKLSSLQV